MNVNTDDPVHCRGYYNESFRSECVCLGGGYEGTPYLGCIGKYFFSSKNMNDDSTLVVEKMMILLS